MVGAATVAREAYPDHTAWDPGDRHHDPKNTPDNPIWFMVEIRAERQFARLVTQEQWDEIITLGSEP